MQVVKLKSSLRGGLRRASATVVLLFLYDLMFNRYLLRSKKPENSGIQAASWRSLVIFTTIAGPELSATHSKHVRTVNALRSFESLEATDAVFLVADDKRVCAEVLLAELGLSKTKCVPSVTHSQFLRTTVTFLLSKMQELTPTGFDALYVNSDVMLMRNFELAYRCLKRISDDYAMTGKRIDYDVASEWDFSDQNFLETMHRDVEHRGLLHGKYGLDYFLFSKSALKAVANRFPPFLVGVYRWDNVMLADLLLEKDVTVFDASEVTTVIHQGTEVHDHLQEPGSKYNNELAAKHIGNSFMKGNTDNIRFKLVQRGHELAIVPTSVSSNAFARREPRC